MTNEERRVLAHRFIYYCLDDNIASDALYDKWDNEARGKYPKDSPVHKVGSSNVKDYPPEVRALALRLIQYHRSQK